MNANVIFTASNKATNVAYSKGILVYGENLKNPKGKVVYEFQDTHKVSQDKLVKGDWYYNINKKTFHQFTGKGFLPENYLKVISTTNTDLIAHGVKAIGEKDLKYTIRHYATPAQSQQETEKTMKKIVEKEFAPVDNHSEKRRAGRPKGSPNKAKAEILVATEKRHAGRPKGSPNKPKDTVVSTTTLVAEKRHVGRPKGSPNKAKSEKPIVAEKRRVGRPKGSPNKPKNLPIGLNKPNERINEIIQKIPKKESTLTKYVNELPTRPSGKDVSKTFITNDNIIIPKNLNRPIEIGNIAEFKRFLTDKMMRSISLNYNFDDKESYITFIKGVVSQIAHEYHTRNTLSIERVKGLIEDAFNAGMNFDKGNKQKGKAIIINEFMSNNELA